MRIVPRRAELVEVLAGPPTDNTAVRGISLDSRHDAATPLNPSWKISLVQHRVWGLVDVRAGHFAALDCVYVALEEFAS